MRSRARGTANGKARDHDGPSSSGPGSGPGSAGELKSRGAETHPPETSLPAWTKWPLIGAGLSGSPPDFLQPLVAALSPAPWKWQIVFILGGILSTTGFVPPPLILSCLVLLVLHGMATIGFAQFFLREVLFVPCFCRELVFCLFALYVDNVAVYLVAVTHEYRFREVVLQDNVKRLLMKAFVRVPLLERALVLFPEITSLEAMFMIIACSLYSCSNTAPGRSGWGQFSFGALFGRTLRCYRWCRYLRVVCFVVTVMPSQKSWCFANRFDVTLSQREHAWEALSHWRNGGGCNDLIFSGHMIAFVLCCLACGQAALSATGGRPLGNFDRGMLAVVWLRLVHAFLRIVHSGMHLSVDLVVAVVVTALVWYGDSTRITASKPPRRPHLRAWRSCTRSFWFWPAVAIGSGLLSLGLLLYDDAGGTGPLSALNRERVRQLLPAPAENLAPGSPAAGHKKIRLFCATLHTFSSPTTRARFASAAAGSWAHQCDEILFWDEKMPDIAALSAEVEELEPVTGTHPGDRWLRMRRILRHIGKRETRNRFDWYLILDESSFIVPENLFATIRIIEAEAGNQHRALHAAPRRDTNWGGIINSLAMAEMMKALDGNFTGGTSSSREAACPIPSRTKTGNKIIVYDLMRDCMQKGRGVPVIEWERSSAVMKALGCGSQGSTVLNLKVVGESVCRSAVVVYFMSRPSWVLEVAAEIFRKRRVEVVG